MGLATDINTYVEFFSAQRDVYFTRSGDGFDYKPEAFGKPHWKEIRQSMDEIFSDPNRPAGIESMKDYRELAIPQIVTWLIDNNVSKLSHYLDGRHSALWKTKDDINSHTVVRMGDEDGTLGNWANKRVWCPLGIQPDARAFLKYGKVSTGVMEILPLMGNVPNPVAGFGKFIDEYVLAGTPYIVFNNKDLGVMRDGTPVYLDADCILFENAELADLYDRDQFNPAWQQDVMCIIDKNCRRHQLPEPLSWVTKDASGLFVTKQTLLHPNPQLRRSIRQTIDFKVLKR